MAGASAGLTFKGLAVLVVLVAAMMPLSMIATASASNKNQQNNDPTNPVAAGASSASAYWARAYGGSGSDVAYFVKQTADGGCIVAGYTNSSGAGYDDFWVLKLNSTGGVTWQNTYGAAGYDDAASVQQTADGGYILAGNTYSTISGLGDFWLLKLDPTGEITWQKRYGGSGDDVSYCVLQTSDGGYLQAGTTNSFGTIGYDVWVLKVDSTGTVVWQKTYGGSGDDVVYYAQQTTDGGYILAGATTSFGAGGSDAWVLKLNSNGSVAWQKNYGGPRYEAAAAVQQNTDGDYVVAAVTDSLSGAGYDDFWVFELNSNGSVMWQKTYGGPDYDDANSIQQTADGGYIVAGTTYSYGAGACDYWVLKLDSTGGISWQNAYGGAGDDEAWYIQQTSDGGYMVAGDTSSFGAGGGYDCWVVKVQADGSITWGSGSGASTTATYVIPSDTMAEVSSSSAIPVNSNAITVNTSVSPHATSATVTEQSPQTIVAPSGISLMIIIVAVGAGVVLLSLIAVVLARRSRRSRGYPQPARTWGPRSPIQPDLTLRRPAAVNTLSCPYCGAASVPEARFCENCGAYLQA